MVTYWGSVQYVPKSSAGIAASRFLVFRLHHIKKCGRLAAVGDITTCIQCSSFQLCDVFFTLSVMFCDYFRKAQFVTGCYCSYGTPFEISNTEGPAREINSTRAVVWVIKCIISAMDIYNCRNCVSAQYTRLNGHIELQSSYCAMLKSLRMGKLF